MTPFILRPLSTTLSLSLMLLLITPMPVMAQAYRGQVEFLEAFAVKLYERGDLVQSLKEFDRIRRMDPNNTKAAEYIKKIETALGPSEKRPNLQRLDSVLSDMNTLRLDIADGAKESEDLIILVRNLIHENDDLYMTLYKRTRELAEMRAKFEGTPYIEEYDRLMKSLPVERVPQRTHQTNDLLDLLEKQQATVSTNFPPMANETESLIQEVVSKKKDVKESAETKELAASLEEKREALTEKKSTIDNGNAALESIKTELATVNASLRAAKDQYAQMINMIDQYNRSIKSEIGEKNFSEQKQFADLLLDYSAKLEELESLRREAAQKTAALIPAARETLAAQEKRITSLDEIIKNKDQQIADFKTLLNQYQEELAKAEKIAEQAGKRIGSIETLLKESGDGMDVLQTSVSKVKELLVARPASPIVNQTEITSDDEVLVKSLRDEIKRLKKEMQDQAKILGKNILPPSAAGKLAILRDEAKEKDTRIANLKKELAEINARTRNSAAALETANLTIASLTEEKNTLTRAALDRETFLKNMNRRLDDLATTVKNKDLAIDTQRRGINTLTSQVERLEQDIKSSKKAAEEKTAALRALETQNRSLKNDLLKANRVSGKEQSPVAATISIPSPMTYTDVCSRDTEKIVGLQKTVTEKEKEISSLRVVLADKERAIQAASPAAPAEVMDTATLKALSLDIQNKSASLELTKQQLQEKTMALSKTTEEIKKLKEQMSAQDFKQTAVREVVDKRDQEVKRVTAEIETKTKELALVTAERDSLKKLVASKDSSSIQAQSSLQEKDQEALLLKKEIETLRETVTNSHAEISRQGLLIDKSNADIKKLLAQLSAKEQEIATLQKDINALRTK